MSSSSLDSIQCFSLVVFYLDLKDILTLAMVKKPLGSIILTDHKYLTRLIISNKLISHIDKEYLNIVDISISGLRKMVSKITLLHVKVAATESDNGTDNVKFSLDERMKLSQESFDTNDLIGNGNENDDSMEIMKHLEVASFDEFDDFNPIHPVPRNNKTHRRGDSYFNSDVSDVATLALAAETALGLGCGLGLGSIAKMALLAEGLDGMDTETLKPWTQAAETCLSMSHFAKLALEEEGLSLDNGGSVLSTRSTSR